MSETQVYNYFGSREKLCVDIARREIRAAPSEVEVQMHARAARMAREVLEKELASGVAQTTDHELTGRLERLLPRRHVP